MNIFGIDESVCLAQRNGILSADGGIIGGDSVRLN
jgi:hypothetical protein